MDTEPAKDAEVPKLTLGDWVEGILIWPLGSFFPLHLAAYLSILFIKPLSYLVGVTIPVMILVVDLANVYNSYKDYELLGNAYRQLNNRLLIYRALLLILIFTPLYFLAAAR